MMERYRSAFSMLRYFVSVSGVVSFVVISIEATLPRKIFLILRGYQHIILGEDIAMGLCEIL